MAFASANVAYGIKQYPTNGPFPRRFSPLDSRQQQQKGEEEEEDNKEWIVIKYDKGRQLWTVIANS